MAQILRQSTQVKVVIGPVVAVANGYIPVTTLDLSTADEAELLKHDAGSVTDISAATFAAITSADGYYNLTLSTSHTDTCGMITVLVNDDSLCLPVKATFQVVEEAIYDAYYAASATGLLPANVTQIGGDTQSATDLKDFADAGYDPSTNKVQGVVLVDTVTTLTNLPAITANWLTATGIAADAFTTAKFADGALTAAKFASGALDAVWSTGTRTLTAATNITTAIAAAVWEVATSGLTSAGTIGKLLVDNINTTISSRSSHSASDVATAVWAAGARTLTAATNITADIATAVWASGTRTLTTVSGLGIATAAKLLAYVRLLARSDAANTTDLATELGEINADSGSGAGDFAATTDSLEAIRDRGDAEWVTGAGGGGGGSGARTVTITVNDGVTALQNANVRMIQGAENYVVATNASGVAVFALDDATWSVAITKPGYTFTPTTLIVNGTETQTYSMTALTITPSSPGQVTGYLTIFGIDGEVEQGAEIHLQQLQPMSGSGIGYDGAVRTEESGVDGVVEFTNMFKGGRYNIWRGTDTANKKQFTLASNATDPTALSSFVGSP